MSTDDPVESARRDLVVLASECLGNTTLPEFQKYLDTLDADSLRVGLYLMWQAGVSASALPKVLRLIDVERAQSVLDEVQIALDGIERMQ